MNNVGPLNPPIDTTLEHTRNFTAVIEIPIDGAVGIKAEEGQPAFLEINSPDQSALKALKELMRENGAKVSWNSNNKYAIVATLHTDSIKLYLCNAQAITSNPTFKNLGNKLLHEGRLNVPFSNWLFGLGSQTEDHYRSYILELLGK